MCPNQVQIPRRKGEKCLPRLAQRLCFKRTTFGVIAFHSCFLKFIQISTCAEMPGFCILTKNYINPWQFCWCPFLVWFFCDLQPLGIKSSRLGHHLVYLHTTQQQAPAPRALLVWVHLATSISQQGFMGI